MMTNGAIVVGDLDRQVVLGLGRQQVVGLAVADAAPEDQAPDDHSDDQRGDRGPGPQRAHPVGLVGDAGRPAEAQLRLGVVRGAAGEQHRGRREQAEPRQRGARLRCTGETAFLISGRAVDGHVDRDAQHSRRWRLSDAQVTTAGEGAAGIRRRPGQDGIARRRRLASRCASRRSGYFDAAAGLPLHPVAVEACRPPEDGWADPSRLTGAGRRSAVLLDAARQAAAAELGLPSRRAELLPSGAHALQPAVLGSLAGPARGPATGWCTRRSSTPPSSQAADWHARARRRGRQVAGVEATGRVGWPTSSTGRTGRGRPPRCCRPPTTRSAPGSRSPRSAGALAAPAFRWWSTPATSWSTAPHRRAPVFTADARLWGGPAGVGLLAIRQGSRWRPPFPTDEAEGGRAPGPVNVPAIVAAAGVAAGQPGRPGSRRPAAGRAGRR